MREYAKWLRAMFVVVFLVGGFVNGQCFESLQLCSTGYLSLIFWVLFAEFSIKGIQQ